MRYANKSTKCIVVVFSDSSIIILPSLRWGRLSYKLKISNALNGTIPIAMKSHRELSSKDAETAWNARLHGVITLRNSENIRICMGKKYAVLMIKLIFFNYPSFSIMIYLATLTHYGRVSRLCLTHKWQSAHAWLTIRTKKQNSFQFHRNVSKKWLVLTSCPNCITKRKNCCGSAQRLSEHLRTFSPKFGSLRKIKKIFGSRWDIFRNLGHDKIRRKSHAFDSEKVGRYTMRFQLHTQNVVH